MKSKSFRFLGHVSAIALLSVTVSSPAQAFWFSDLFKIKHQPPKCCTSTPAPTPTPSPTPTPTPPPPPPSGSTGGSTDVPEPGLVGLFGLGVAGLLYARRRKRSAAKPV